MHLEHGIELRHLRYVIAAAENGSFRRAAIRLGVCESSISRQVRDLEDRIGASLFIRNYSGVILTYAGHRFISMARSAMVLIGNATRDTSCIGQGHLGLIRIGLSASMASDYLVNLLQVYAGDHPGVRIEFVEGDPADHLQQIREHRLDVAFLTGSSISKAQGCDVLNLWNERMVVVMAERDELAKKQQVNWNDLGSRHVILSEAQPGPELYQYILKRSANRIPKIEVQAVYRDTLIQIVASNGILTLANESTIAVRVPGVVTRPIEREYFAFCAVWSPQNDNPAFRRFLSLAKIISKSNGRL